MNRSAGRRQVFLDDAQRRYFLSLLAETHRRYRAEWHAYCLMGNHYHLMVRTPEGNLQRIMRHINGLYTQYVNRIRHTDGPLFRGRYKAILVEADAYWLQLSRYIHRNPLEAGITQRLDRYRWSSYPAYIGKTATPEWLTTHDILGAIGKRRVQARYQDYVCGNPDDTVDDFYHQSRSGPILGGNTFKSRIIAGLRTSVDTPELSALLPRPTAEEIIQAVQRHYDVPESEIFVSRRGLGIRSPARSVAMYLCQEIGALKLSNIAKIFGLANYASASSSIRAVRARLDEDKGLVKSIKSIMLDLTPAE